MTVPVSTCEAIGMLREQFQAEISRDPSLSQPARAAMNDVISLLSHLEGRSREEPDVLARDMMQLARSRPTLVVEIVRHLRQWSLDLARPTPTRTEGDASRGYVTSEAPGSAFLQSDLEAGGNLSAVSGSSAVVQGEEVDS
jgi:hypothetical protein